MAKRINEGKRFEEDFKNSIPPEVWYYRFKDGTSSWGSNDKDSNTRFQSKNICDCELYVFPWLCLFELKTTKEKRFPLSMIKMNQIIELYKASKHKGILPGFIVNFREHEQTFFMRVEKLIELYLGELEPFDAFIYLGRLKGEKAKGFEERCYNLLTSRGVKSLPFSMFTRGHNAKSILQTKKVSRFRYDIVTFLNVKRKLK